MTAALETGLDKESMQTLIGGFGADSDMIAKATLLGIQTLAGEIETGKGLKVFIP